MEFDLNRFLSAQGRCYSQALADFTAFVLSDYTMTLFDAVSPGDVFAKVLEKYYGEGRDKLTLKMLSINNQYTNSE